MSLVSLLFQSPFLFIVIIAVFLLALSIHEASHAYASHLLGDDTAKRMGRLTLNPFAHIDPAGFLALVLIGFGWGKPVPFNTYNLKYQRWGPAMVAAAGPFSNLIFGTICALAFRWLMPVLGPENLLVFFLQYAAYLNFILLLFNLIPLPPLDGSKALLAALAHPKFARMRFFIESKGPLLLIGLILLDVIFQTGIFNGLSHAADGLFNLIIH